MPSDGREGGSSGDAASAGINELAGKRRNAPLQWSDDAALVGHFAAIEAWARAYGRTRASPHAL